MMQGLQGLTAWASQVASSESPNPSQFYPQIFQLVPLFYPFVAVWALIALPSVSYLEKSLHPSHPQLSLGPGCLRLDHVSLLPKPHW